jgi:antitoxin component of MazEF toxin-antitoxin module
MHSKQVTIEDWDGDGAIRLPDEALQELGLDVGDTLYIVETYVGTQKAFVLSTTPKIADRMDELVEELSVARELPSLRSPLS